ncbi:MAG: hypothetical protein PHR54_06830 [Anaerolineaceae bacterium]|nr:hypothetical protein [Anaerolineaceae bacterium]
MMKTKNFLFSTILITLLLSACVPIVTLEQSPSQTPLPADVPTTEPTEEFTSTSETTSGPEVVRLDKLTMEVYELLANASSDDGSFKTTSGSSNEILKTRRPLRDVFDQPFSPPPVNGRQLTASENFVDEKMIVVAKLDNEEVLTIDCGDPSPINNLRGTWVIVDDWFVEVAHTDNEADGNNVYSYGTGEIFMNGVSLNEQFGYYETFGFQPLNEKPFYFFSKDGEIGISYDGEVSTLDFDSVQHYACCSAGAFNPKAYLTMVTFFASKGDKNYYVEMGLFSAFDLDILDISGAGLTVEAFELQDGSWPDEEHHQSRPAGSLPGWVLKRHEDERKNGIPYQETSQFQGKLLSAKVNAENPKEAAVEVMLDDEVVLNMQIGDFTRFAAMSLLYKVFADTEHWYLEMAIQCKTSDGIVSCEPTGEIFRNGVSLNQLNGYDETFGFQLLAGEPFFFFKKGDEYGLNYADEEVVLGFDEIAHHYCCGFSIYNPTHYEDMVTFFASKDGVRYYVEAGVFR